MGTKKNNGEKNRHILIYLTSLFPCTLQTFLMFLFQCTNFLFLESILYFMLEALLHHQVSLKKMMIVESFFLYIIKAADCSLLQQDDLLLLTCLVA